MADTVSRSPDSDKRAGDDAPTQSRAGGDATLPLKPGMTPGSPQAAGGPATRLGPYELIELLGRGGMGTVWKARHTKLDKLVALKLLPPHLMSDTDAVGRFEREMRAVGKLEHAHIVRAMDAGEADGIHYLVMEYIEGVDLSRLVKHRGPRKLAEACQMIRHAALGLAHAHEHGLVHRDIKPSNLLLSKRGFVKILDLGLARLQTEKAVGEASLTVQGEVMGTPDYMAPEQWQSAHSVGPAADLYALGCTLHYLLKGRAPFAAADQSSCTHKMTAHLLQPPPPLPDVPPELEALYQKLMAKEPNARPASAKQLADELRAMIRSWTHSPAPAETIPWTPVVGSTTKIKRPSTFTKSHAWIVGGAIALVVLLAAAIWLTSSSQRRPRTGDDSHTELNAKANSATTSSQPPLATAPFLAPQAREFQDAWARYLGVPVEYMNSLGMQFRLIPPGEYDRGAPKERIEPLLGFLKKWEDEKNIGALWRAVNEAGIRSEAPQHRVRIAQPFYLAACEVTQGRFEQVMKFNHAYFGPTGGGKDQVSDRGRSELPVESVTFSEALEFCQKLAEREGFSGGNMSSAYRLPTDAEWEFACRAGTTTPFWFGYPTDEAKLMARYDEATPLRVARLKANPFGLYDTHGNVWELCEDYFSSDDFARYESGIAESPTGPAGGGWHVIRGGCYAVGSVMCRSASRAAAQGPMRFFGFRPALSVEAVQSKIRTGEQKTTSMSGPPPADEPAAAGELYQIGRKLCFVEDEWEKGVPILAKCNHAAIRTAAAGELAGSGSPERQAEVGRLWYQAAATAEDPDNWHCFRRARYWLNKALKEGSDDARAAWFVAAQRQLQLIPMLRATLRIKTRSFNNELITISRNKVEWISRDGQGPNVLSDANSAREFISFNSKYGVQERHAFDIDQARWLLPEAVDFTTASLRVVKKEGSTGPYTKGMILKDRSDQSKVVVRIAEWDNKRNAGGNYYGNFEVEALLSFGLAE